MSDDGYGRSDPRSAATRRRRPLSAALLAVLALACAAVTLTAAAATETGDARGPLDLTDVTLGQQDVRVSLKLTTGGSWTAADLEEPGRSICVTLVHGEPAAPHGRICVSRRGGASALSYTPLAADGTTELARQNLPADVSRPSPGVLEATFLPAAAGLPVGSFAWSAESRWTDDASCATGCGDRLPDSGTVAGELGLLGVPRCFGAAARDPQKPCDNPDLRMSVEPPLERARDILNSYCDERRHSGLLAICSFGAARGLAAGTFAVVGDSHAAGLKTALEVLTLARGWRGISIVRSACPATQAGRPILPTQERSQQCGEWNRELLAWLAKRPELDAVFLSAHRTAKVAPTRGRSVYETARGAYRSEIRALLRRARRVVVIRDTPSSPPGHLSCIAQALSAGRPPGSVCGQSRDAAVGRDPLAAAAGDLRSDRVRLIDLTDHFCDAQRCFDVVGGALVHRDETHLTPAFSASLGPYIVRALPGG